MSYKSNFYWGIFQISIGLLLLALAITAGPLWLIIWDVVFGVIDLAFGVHNIIIGARKLKRIRHE